MIDIGQNEPDNLYNNKNSKPKAKPIVKCIFCEKFETQFKRAKICQNNNTKNSLDIETINEIKESKEKQNTDNNSKISRKSKNSVESKDKENKEDNVKIKLKKVKKINKEKEEEKKRIKEEQEKEEKSEEKNMNKNYVINFDKKLNPQRPIEKAKNKYEFDFNNFGNYRTNNINMYNNNYNI